MAKYGVYILLFFFVSACTVGPDYKRIETAADRSAGYINASDENKKHFTMSKWWERIGDPLLDTYVEQLLGQNLALKEAGERMIQARERVNTERGGYFPTLSADGSASRSFSPGLDDSFGQTERVYTTSYEAGLNTSWEIDLFGKIRRSVASAEAGFEATVYDREALIHALIADMLNRRIAIAVNKNLLDFAKKNAENRKQIHDLVKRRYDLGVGGTTLADVYLAEENYTTVRAEIHEFERLLADETYRLDLLLGQPPGTTDPLQSDFPLLPPPLDVPVRLPADLLDRRPDLKASELRVKSETADIGVAVADLYPSLSLGGSIGFTGNGTNNLFTAEQLAGSIFASVMTRIFEGGALRANIRIQASEARELAAVYANDVLEAMREVETALKAEQELDRELGNTQRSVDALRRAEQISEDRYVRGIQTLRDLLDTQQRRYSAEQNLLRTQQEKWNTRVSLYLALGGDWLGNPSDPDLESAPQSEEKPTS